MIIKNLNNQYYVIEKKKANKDFDILYCRLMNSDTNKGRTVDLIKIKNREKMPFLIETFTEKDNTATFYDMYECFSKNGFFYIVFEHSDSPSLREKLSQEHCSLRERLEIGKNLLEKAILLAMPEFLQAEIMNPDNILVSNDITVSFSYEISTLSKEENTGFEMIMANVTVVMEALFATELERNESEDIRKFIETCNEYRFRDFMEFYQEYSRFYDVITTQDAGGFIKPNTLIFKIWDKVKSIFVKSKGIVVKIVILILIIYMVQAIFATEKKQGTDFNMIGTVEIEKEKSSE